MGANERRGFRRQLERSEVSAMGQRFESCVRNERGLRHVAIGRGGRQIPASIESAMDELVIDAVGALVAGWRAR
jgi:hypothetical protein